MVPGLPTVEHLKFPLDFLFWWGREERSRNNA